MASISDPQTRQRAHADGRSPEPERRSQQAFKLVEKWKTRLAELDRAGVAARQAKLFAEDQDEGPCGVGKYGHSQLIKMLRHLMGGEGLESSTPCHVYRQASSIRLLTNRLSP